MGSLRSQVTVDMLNGETRVDDFVAAGSGKVINPVLASGQIEGGGAGYRLRARTLEGLPHGEQSDDQLHRAPTAADIPPV
jgi:CO/xanthine dehydrogenase Mo-binding subunit